MKFVEQAIPGFHWAEPVTKEGEFLVDNLGSTLRITGNFPFFTAPNAQQDLIWQYEHAPRKAVKEKQHQDELSPEIQFVNAHNDEKLIRFVQRYGPVIAERVQAREAGWEGMSLSEMENPPLRIFAFQDMEELRREQAIYRAAFQLILMLAGPEYDFDDAQKLIKRIADGVPAWVEQWNRQKEQHWEPNWLPRPKSIERIQALASGQKDSILSPDLEGCMVICELLNTFPPFAFPNIFEVSNHIRYGVRPLLYALLRRQFFAQRSTGNCANENCRNVYYVTRVGKKFCTAECSQHQRQRDYWQDQGKKRREDRIKNKMGRKKSKKRPLE